MICSCSPGRVPGPFAAGGAGREPRPLYFRGGRGGKRAAPGAGGPRAATAGRSRSIPRVPARCSAPRHAWEVPAAPKNPNPDPDPSPRSGAGAAAPVGGCRPPAPPRSAPLPPAARPAPSPPGGSAEPGRCSPGSRASRRPAGLLRGTTIPRPPCSSAGRLEGAGLSIRERQRGERAGDPPPPPRPPPVPLIISAWEA